MIWRETLSSSCLVQARSKPSVGLSFAPLSHGLNRWKARLIPFSVPPGASRPLPYSPSCGRIAPESFAQRRPEPSSLQAADDDLDCNELTIPTPLLGKPAIKNMQQQLQAVTGNPKVRAEDIPLEHPRTHMYIHHTLKSQRHEHGKRTTMPRNRLWAF